MMKIGITDGNSDGDLGDLNIWPLEEGDEAYFETEVTEEEWAEYQKFQEQLTYWTQFWDARIILAEVEREQS